MLVTCRVVYRTWETAGSAAVVSAVSAQVDAWVFVVPLHVSGKVSIRCPRVRVVSS